MVDVEQVFGGGGDDIIDASLLSYGIYFYGAEGNDTMIGGSGGDTFHGKAGADSYFGNGGDDWIHFESGDIIVSGGVGGWDRALANGSVVLGDVGEAGVDLVDVEQGVRWWWR